MTMIRILVGGLLFLVPITAFAPIGALAEQQSADYDVCTDDDAVASERIAACTRVISQGGDQSVLSDAFRNRGDVYGDREQWPAAIADDTKAIELNPEDAEAYNQRAWAHLKSGDMKKAFVDVNKSLSLDPKQADTWDTRGRTYEAMGKVKEAISDYKQALAIEPDHEDSKDALDRLGGH